MAAAAIPRTVGVQSVHGQLRPLSGVTLAREERMGKTIDCRRMVLAVCVTLPSLAPSLWGGPDRSLFIISATERGGKSEILVLQGDSVVRSWTTQHGKELGIAVARTVRTLGQLGGDVGAEYTLDGTPTGVDYPSSFSPTSFVQFLDGTTDGFHNYAWDFTNGSAYRFNLD